MIYTINFSALNFTIRRNLPNIEQLESLFTNSKNNFERGGEYYLIKSENINDNYFWLYARYGSPTPRHDKVFDVQSKEEEDNPRQNNQAELRKQLFCMYDYNSRILYLSNQNSRGFLIDYFEYISGESVIIKFFLLESDKFLGQLKSIDELKFVYRRNIYDYTSFAKIISLPYDITAINQDADVTIGFKYNSVTPIGKKLLESLKSLFGRFDKNSIDSLICVGKDDKNFETIFNSNTFTHKIAIENCEKEESGLYNTQDIKQKLLEKLGQINAKTS